jgi:peptidoglycan hydrolase-like protein with peptidoglycan-binding domain
MRHLVLIATLALAIGLFAGGLVLGAENEMGGTSQSNTSGSMNEKMQQNTASMQLNQQQIREMQTLLNQRGFQVGEADGVLGQQTRNALRQFQQSEGLASTGTPTRETLRALAPSAEKQQFFGLSPAYEEKGQHQMKHQQMEQQQQMQQHRMEHQQTAPKGSRY